MGSRGDLDGNRRGNSPSHTTPGFSSTSMAWTFPQNPGKRLQPSSREKTSATGSIKSLNFISPGRRF
jgi:hypothetical protein